MSAPFLPLLSYNGTNTVPVPIDNVLHWPPPHSRLDDTRPPDRLALWHLWGANMYTLLTALCSVSAAWWVTFVIVLAVNGTLNVGHFTYWSLVLYTLVDVALALALYVRRGMLTFVVLWLLPVVQGTTWLVSVGIVVILSLDATAFVNGSVCDGTTGQTTMERLHTGDWLLHVLPVVGTSIKMHCGLQFEARDIYRGRMSQWSVAQTWLYRTFFEVSPLPFIGLYGALYNVREVYSVAPPMYLVWLGVIGFVLGVQLVYLLAFTLNKRHKQRLEPAEWWAAAVQAAHAALVDAQRQQQTFTADTGTAVSGIEHFSMLLQQQHANNL